MATTRPFAYNTGAPIGGTTQVGNLAVGNSGQDYSTNPGGIPWWNGPDEELGYVIALPVPGNTQPTPIFGVTASVGFLRTNILTDNEFINLSEYVAFKNGTPQTFTTASEASIWLTTNGFWNSYQISVIIELEGFYFQGSVGAGYQAIANQILEDDVTINFTNVLGTITGPPLLINGSVEILSGQTSGYTQVFVNYDYNDLTQVSSFTGVTFDITGSTQYDFTGETTGATFNVTPTPTNTETPTPTPTPTPTNTPTEAIVVTPTLTPTETEVIPVTPTPTPTETEVIPVTPTPTETEVIPVTPTPTETEVIPVTPTPTETEVIPVTPTPTPTETEVIVPTPTPTNTPTTP